MNWGKSIVLTFILFAGFIGVMIYKMSCEHIDLVRDDYYQTEIAYQQQINRMANAYHHQPMAMTYEPARQQLVVSLPARLQKGKLDFYRPADRQLDFKVPILANQAGRQRISTAKLARGLWRVQFAWSDGQQDYYTEDVIYL